MAAEPWTAVALGKILAPVDRTERVEDARTYRLIGVRWYGNGCHLHAEFSGAKLKTRVLNRVETHDVIYNKMWTKKGAFSVVTREHDGLYRTSEYPTFRPHLGLLDPEFLQQRMRLQDFIEQASNLCRGTTSRARLNPTDFLKLSIKLPPLAEQRKIAAILSSVDDTIESTAAVIGQLEVVKKGLLGELLTRGMPGRHKEFKKTEVGIIPASWTVQNMGQVCLVENNLRKPLNRSEREKMPGPYPYYGPTRALDHINEFRADGTYALIGEDGDHFLKFSKWPMTQLVFGRFNVNNHVHLVRGTKICLTEWFYVFFLHRDITGKLTRQGANRYKLKKETLLALLIALPQPDEQQEITQALASFKFVAAAHSKALAQLREVKAALSEALLSGRVRVCNLPQEAA